MHRIKREVGEVERNALARRRKELAKIHVLTKSAGLDEDTYRDVLERLTGQRSAARLTDAQRATVLDHLQKLTAGKRTYPGRPHNITHSDRSPLLTKVEALLADQGLPWSYAAGIARQMYQREKLEFCDQRQLRGVITALVKRQQKEA